MGRSPSTSISIGIGKRPAIKSRSMGLVLHIPDSNARAIRLPEERLEDKLLAELAVALHAQNMLAFGKARELASLSH